MSSQLLTAAPKVATVMLFAALLNSSHVAASDALCAQLQSFEAAPFESGQDGKPLRKSVTFIWKGPWLGEHMEWACNRKISDPWAIGLCKYLMDNTSLEFRANLPIRVLSCYGYRFRQFAAYD